MSWIDPQQPPDDQRMDPLKRNRNTGVNGGAQTMPGTMVNSTAPPAAPSGPTPYDRTRFRDDWMATGNDTGAQDALLQRNGITLSGNGTGTLPGGEIMDLRRGARAGDNTAQWMGVGEMQNGQANYYGAGGGGGQAGAGAGGSGFQDSVRQQLLDLMKGADTPVDESDPSIAQPFAAAKLEASRGQDAERRALSEQLFAGGNGSVDQGQLGQGIQQSAERMATGLGGIKSGLIQRTYQNKIQRAQQALQLAVQSGDAESARQIQMQLAQMDNAFRQSQWNDQYGLSKSDRQYERDRDAARAKSGLAF
jgi:hypothetical protein